MTVVPSKRTARECADPAAEVVREPTRPPTCSRLPVEEQRCRLLRAPGGASSPLGSGGADVILCRRSRAEPFTMKPGTSSCCEELKDALGEQRGRIGVVGREAAVGEVVLISGVEEQLGPVG
jgi:hypothetical protein